MAVILNERKYPTVIAEPSVSDIVGAFRREDWQAVGLSGLAGAPIGYYLGHSVHLARPSMFMGIGLATTACLAVVLQNSAARLMGYMPNDQEVAKLAEQAPGLH